jgi:VanZ family protein
MDAYIGNQLFVAHTGDFRDGSDWIMAKVFQILSATAAWISLAFIAYATLSPLKERPEISAGFLILFSHFDQYVAFAVMGSLFGFAYPRQTLLVCILVLGSAILLELAQILTPDRHARLMDAARKIIGGAFGIAFAYFTMWLRP